MRRDVIIARGDAAKGLRRSGHAAGVDLESRKCLLNSPQVIATDETYVSAIQPVDN